MLHHSDLIWEYIINRLHNNKSDLRFGGHILYEFDDFYKGLDHYIKSNEVLLSVNNKLTINIYKFNAYEIIWNINERKISIWSYINPLRTVVDYPLENYEDIFNKPVNINTIDSNHNANTELIKLYMLEDIKDVITLISMISIQIVNRCDGYKIDVKNKLVLGMLGNAIGRPFRL